LTALPIFFFESIKNNGILDTRYAFMDTFKKFIGGLLFGTAATGITFFHGTTTIDFTTKSRVLERGFPLQYYNSEIGINNFFTEFNIFTFLGDILIWGIPFFLLLKLIGLIKKKTDKRVPQQSGIKKI